MKRSELNKMKKAGLLELAKKRRIRISPGMLKADIVETIYGRLSGKAGTKASGRTVRKAKAAAKAIRGRAGTKRKSKGVAPTAKQKAKAKGAKGKRTAKAGKAAPKAAGKKTQRTKPSPPSRARENGRTIRQMAVTGKYELTAGPITMPPVESMKIPDTYNLTRIVAMARDPHWLFTYWEICAERFRQLEKKFGNSWTECTMALRIYDRSGKGGAHFDLGIAYDTRSWYIKVDPGGRYQVAIGVITPTGRFVKIAESEIIETPRDSISDVIDDRWLIPDDVYDRIFAASGGYDFGAGASAGLRLVPEKDLQEQLGSGAVSSFGSGELHGREEGKRMFKLRVATELILYGATDPDAQVTVRGKKIKLRGDGTFTARFALPDGKLELPVKARSGDRIEERTIDTAVSKKSKEKEPIIK